MLSGRFPRHFPLIFCDCFFKKADRFHKRTAGIAFCFRFSAGKGMNRPFVIRASPGSGHPGHPDCCSLLPGQCGTTFLSLKKMDLTGFSWKRWPWPAGLNLQDGVRPCGRCGSRSQNTNGVWKPRFWPGPLWVQKRMDGPVRLYALTKLFWKGQPGGFPEQKRVLKICIQPCLSAVLFSVGNSL